MERSLGFDRRAAPTPVRGYFFARAFLRAGARRTDFFAARFGFVAMRRFGADDLRAAGRDFFAADFRFAVDFFATLRLSVAFFIGADFLRADFFAADFFTADFFAADFFAADFFATDFFAADFFAADFFAADFFLATFFLGAAGAAIVAAALIAGAAGIADAPLSKPLPEFIGALPGFPLSDGIGAEPPPFIPPPDHGLCADIRSPFGRVSQKTSRWAPPL
ncbi:MAG: hypothetical protein ACYC0B_05435 [Gemmatimonadaceae bacterium]